MLKSLENCEICCKAKQTRLPFKIVRSKAKRPLQLIHTDLCGPIDPVACNEKKYILTFIDDYTHYTMVYLLKGKHEVPDALINYVLKVERQKDVKVNKIRCDNGREYKNNKLEEWTYKKGIEFDCTVPHTPQLNGYVPNAYRLWDPERKKVIIARDVKFKTDVPIECVKKTNKIEVIEEEDEDLPTDEDDEEENEKYGKGGQSEYEDAEQETDEDEDTTKEKELRIMETPRKLSRERKPPARYGDYVYLTYVQAISGPDNLKWKQAIEEEKRSIEKNKVWKVGDASETNGKKLLTSKWIFKIKDDETYKARLVIRGCEQKQNIDYEETFSPVNSSALRILFAIAARRNYVIATFDIKTTFLYGEINEEINEEIYLLPPE
ncbi:retrotransposon ty1-copia subclass, partial [Lasius niger]